MKKYSVEDMGVEYHHWKKDQQPYKDNEVSFLINKIVELTNRIQELESKGKIDE